MNKLLGNRIKEIRLARKFSQEQVADRLGMSRQRYARIEGGMSNINLDILSKLAEIFDITVGDITKVLNSTPTVSYRQGNSSSDKILEMLDLFYANKHMYDKLKQKDLEEKD